MTEMAMVTGTKSIEYSRQPYDALLKLKLVLCLQFYKERIWNMHVIGRSTTRWRVSSASESISRACITLTIWSREAVFITARLAWNGEQHRWQL